MPKVTQPIRGEPQVRTRLRPLDLRTAKNPMSPKSNVEFRLKRPKLQNNIRKPKMFAFFPPK